MKKQTAKRIAALCAALLLLPSVASCSPAPDTVSDDAGVSRLVTTEYPWTEALTPHVIGDYAPEISVITSRDSLIDYVSIWEKCYDFVDDSVTSTFYDVVTGYDEEFFQTQALVVCVVTTDCPANRYVSEGIGRSGEDYDIRIRYTAPASSAREETVWHIFLEVPDGSPFVRDPSMLRLRFVENKNY